MRGEGESVIWGEGEERGRNEKGGYLWRCEREEDVETRE